MSNMPLGRAWVFCLLMSAAAGEMKVEAEGAELDAMPVPPQ